MMFNAISHDVHIPIKIAIKVVLDVSVGSNSSYLYRWSSSKLEGGGSLKYKSNEITRC
jgi:hypothetical protein